MNLSKISQTILFMFYSSFHFLFYIFQLADDTEKIFYSNYRINTSETEYKLGEWTEGDTWTDVAHCQVTVMYCYILVFLLCDTVIIKNIHYSCFNKVNFDRCTCCLRQTALLSINKT